MTEPDMKLPEGKTCAECVQLPRCRALFSCKEENTECDFAPSRFRALGLFAMIDKACGELPTNYTISLHMENGAAYVECVNPAMENIALPDAADRTLADQVSDALEAAKMAGR